MLVDNLDRFIENDQHEARTEGVVDSRAYGRMRRVDRGRFNLFVNADEPDTRNMLYRLRFVTEHGRRLMLDGYKVVRDDPGPDLWADNTTLYVTIRDGWDPGAVGIATGMLHINVLGFLSLLRSMTVTNAPRGQDLAYATRFGRFFLGTLWDTYVVPKLQS
jgi:cholesterol oxidase